MSPSARSLPGQHGVRSELLPARPEAVSTPLLGVPGLGSPASSCRLQNSRHGCRGAEGG